MTPAVSGWVELSGGAGGPQFDASLLVDAERWDGFR